MIDYAHRRAVTLVCGSSGTGKTTFALRYLVNAQSLACRFLWDPDGQLSDRLGLACAVSIEELNASMADGWSIFDPNTMFPGRHVEGLAWWAGWVFGTAATLPGKKVMLVDEVWRYCNNAAIPQSLAECIQTGRVRGLDCMFATQRPNRLNESVTNEVTECVTFRLQGANALRVVGELGAPVDRVSRLARGEWISTSTETGAELSGRLWGSVSGSRTA